MPKRPSSSSAAVDTLSSEPELYQPASIEDLSAPTPTDHMAEDDSHVKHRRGSSSSRGMSKVVNFVMAMTPVLIVMYLFGVLRSEMARMQQRMDALAMRLRETNVANAPEDDFRKFMSAMQPQQPPPIVAPQQQQQQQPPPLHQQQQHQQPPPLQQQQPPPQHPTAPLHVAPIPARQSPPTQTPPPPPPTPPAPHVQILPQMQPEGAKRSLPRMEEIP